MATATKKKSGNKPAVKKVATKPVAEDETIFGVADVAAIIKVETGKEVKTRDLRVLLRKMARDGRLNREIVAGNRARWEFTGPDDPDVEKIVEAYQAGELDADKKEKLDALKARKADQRAAKKAEEAEEEDEDDSDEELEEDDEESEDDE